MKKIALIIFSWKNSKQTENTFKNLLKFSSKNYKTKVICIYNDIKKDFKEESSNYIKIGFKEHIGLGKASQFIYDLYSDNFDYFVRYDNDFSLKKPSMLFEMIDYMENDNTIGALTCRLLLKDGKLNYGAVKYSYFGGRSFLFDSEKIVETDSFLGAFFIVSTNSLKKIKRFFDPSIILFGEELELSLALKNSGYRVIYYPKCEGIHKCAVTIDQSRAIYTVLKHTNQYYIISKYFGIINRFVFVFFQFLRTIKNLNLFNINLFFRILFLKRVSISEWNRELNEIK